MLHTRPESTAPARSGPPHLQGVVLLGAPRPLQHEVVRVNLVCISRRARRGSRPPCVGRRFRGGGLRHVSVTQSGASQMAPTGTNRKLCQPWGSPGWFRRFTVLSLTSKLPASAL